MRQTWVLTFFKSQSGSQKRKRNPAVLKIFSKFRHQTYRYLFHLFIWIILRMTNTRGLYIIAIAIEIHL